MKLVMRVPFVGHGCPTIELRMSLTTNGEISCNVCLNARYMPDRMSDRTSDRIPDKISDRIPDKMSDKILKKQRGVSFGESHFSWRCLCRVSQTSGSCSDPMADHEIALERTVIILALDLSFYMSKVGSKVHQTYPQTDSSNLSRLLYIYSTLYIYIVFWQCNSQSKTNLSNFRVARQSSDPFTQATPRNTDLMSVRSVI
jgi:hypothetical protein